MKFAFLLTVILSLGLMGMSLPGCSGDATLGSPKRPTPDPKKAESTELPEVTFFGEIKGFGIGFEEKPEYLNVDPMLSINDLVGGGFVLMMRHTLRDNGEGGNLWAADRQGECKKGSSLNDVGIAQAKNIASVIAELKIPIGQLIASPTCRTKQLAELAFGSDYSEKLELVYQPMMKFHEKTFFDLELMKLLSEPITDGTNRVLTGHNNTVERLGIKGVPTKTLKQGDTAVFRPLGNLKFQYIGTISIEDWEK